MRILTAVALLLAVTAAGADEVRLQATATILARCELDTDTIRTREGTQTRSAARCTSTGAPLPYRIRFGNTVTLASLPPNTRATIATTRHGQVLTIEF